MKDFLAYDKETSLIQIMPSDKETSLMQIMPSYFHPTYHPSVSSGKIGVLFVNLGTPEKTDFFSIWCYLREFLSDHRVIETSRWIWLPLLHGIILPKTSLKSGKNYQKIWNTEHNESPLRTYTRAQEKKISEIFSDYPKIMVRYAMRYGQPSIEKTIKSMTEDGCDKIFFFPLYPQYSASTTGAAYDALFHALMKMRFMPTLRICAPYYNHADYINALTLSIEKHLKTLDFKEEILIASFHGLPESYLKKGDPYYNHCQETAELLREKLGYPKEKFLISFQSRFGKEEWLKPYTDETLKKIAQEGIQSVAVVTPGFAVDCLETLEEINIQARQIFLNAGGKNFTYIPCLNDSPEGISTLEKIIKQELQGWVFS